MSQTTSNPNRWLQLTAGEIMQTDVVTVPYSAPVSEVERLLSDNGISGAPVTDHAGHVVGVISVRDVLNRYVEDPDSRPRRGTGYFTMGDAELDEELVSFDLPEEAEETAESLMTPVIYHVSTETSVRETAQTMLDHKIHRVLVTHPKTKQVVGIVSTLGILEAITA